MVKIIMQGCNGHMGQVVSGLVAQDPDSEIVAGVDISGEEKFLWFVLLYISLTSGNIFYLAQ